MEQKRKVAYGVRAAAALKIQRWYKRQDPAVRARLGRRWSESDLEESSESEDEQIVAERELYRLSSTITLT